MAMELIGIGGYAVELKPFYSKRLLQTFRQKNHFDKFGLHLSIPANSGKMIEVRRFEAFAQSTTALTEGTAPAEIQGTWTAVSATVSQYGQWTKLSDVVDKQSFDRVVPATVDNLSKTMKESLDTLTRNVLTAGTNVQYAKTATTRLTIASGMYLTLAELREALRTLKIANAEPISAAGGKFAVITDPRAMFDLQGDQGLVDIYSLAGERGDKNELWDSSFFNLPWGLRVYETTNARVYASAGLSGADVYTTLVIAEEAYIVVDYEAMPPQSIVTPPLGGPADPLKQITVVGYKASHGAAITNQNLLVRIEHLTSVSNAA